MKKLPIVLALVATLGVSGCIGQYNAFRTIQSWNTRATDNKWANSVINVAFWVVPVYPLALAGDFFVFNTVEFWSGKNPLDSPQPPAEQEGVDLDTE